MEIVTLRVYDGKGSIDLPIRDLTQFQGEHLPKLISFFSDSESREFDLYIDRVTGPIVHITLRRYIPLEELFKLGASLYAQGAAAPEIKNDADLRGSNGGYTLTVDTFEQWLAALYYVTASETGLDPRAIKINRVQAQGWFESGATPYQCFRETWNMENDAGA